MEQNTKNKKANRGGSTKYVFANLTMMAIVLTMIAVGIEAIIPSPWLKWLLLGPIAFVISGFIQERLLSGLVNKVIMLLFERKL